MALGYEDISSWSITALSNGSADSAINWVEHQPRASVNNSARSVMAALAKFRDMDNGSMVTGGTANAQTVTTPREPNRKPVSRMAGSKIEITPSGFNSN